MDINCAADFKTLLIQALASGKDMELDLRQATALDVTALQLLWAAEREARGSGRILTLSDSLPEKLFVMTKEAGFDKFPVSVKAPEVANEAAAQANDR
jgi:ABC-type transporter Mla MlaB component